MDPPQYFSSPTANKPRETTPTVVLERIYSMSRYVEDKKKKPDDLRVDELGDVFIFPDISVSTENADLSRSFQFSKSFLNRTRHQNL